MNGAFTYCTNTTEDEIPVDVRHVVVHQDVTNIGTSAFNGRTLLVSVSVPVLGLTQEARGLKSSGQVGQRAFKGCSSLVSFVLPPRVTRITDESFSECTSLTSITLHQQLTLIGRYAFKGCSSLTSIDIDHIPPQRVTLMNRALSRECPSLFIGAYAFQNCSSLTSIDLPERVKDIGPGAFEACSSLTSINIPQGVLLFDFDTFADCTSLVSVTLPQHLYHIGWGAFQRCTSLVSITLPKDVREIDDHAFNTCTSLVSFTIPQRDISIGRRAFEHCTSLTSIALPGAPYEVTIFDTAFNNCDQLDNRQIMDERNDIDILPTHTWLRQRFDGMPIHQACYEYQHDATIQEDIATNQLETIITANIATLHSTDAMGMTALHVLCCNPNATAHAIKVLKDAHPNAASMRNVKGLTPLMMLLECEGLACNDFYVDEEFVSLFRVLELGVEYGVLEKIIGASDVEVGNRLVLAFERKDEESGLIPFMRAALLQQCTLDTVYRLAMRHPHFVSKEEDQVRASKRCRRD